MSRRFFRRRLWGIPNGSTQNAHLDLRCPESHARRTSQSRGKMSKCTVTLFVIPERVYETTDLGLVEKGDLFNEIDGLRVIVTNAA